MPKEKIISKLNLSDLIRGFTLGAVVGTLFPAEFFGLSEEEKFKYLTANIALTGFVVGRIEKRKGRDLVEKTGCYVAGGAIGQAVGYIIREYLI